VVDVEARPGRGGQPVQVCLEDRVAGHQQGSRGRGGLHDREPATSYRRPRGPAGRLWTASGPPAPGDGRRRTRTRVRPSTGGMVEGRGPALGGDEPGRGQRRGDAAGDRGPLSPVSWLAQAATSTGAPTGIVALVFTLCLVATRGGTRRSRDQKEPPWWAPPTRSPRPGPAAPRRSSTSTRRSSPSRARWPSAGRSTPAG